MIGGEVVGLFRVFTNVDSHSHIPEFEGYEFEVAPFVDNRVFLRWATNSSPGTKARLRRRISSP